MRAALAICLLGLVAVVPALTDASPPQALFNQVRAKILNNIARVPRYTCVETIERNMHRPQLGFRPSTCASTIAARAGQSSPGLLTWHDRLRLDVAIVGYAEMFSWAGASAFETGAMDQLAATGATGSGAFSSFLASIFGADADHFQYVGERQTPFGLLSTFEYNVPVGKSHYQTRMGDGKDRIIGYHGAFYVIPATATLRRLEVVAEQFPTGEACRVVDTMDYTTVKIGSGEFMLPAISTMDVLYATGDEAHNETHFSGCREYVANRPSASTTLTTPLHRPRRLAKRHGGCRRPDHRRSRARCEAKRTGDCESHRSSPWPSASPRTEHGADSGMDGRDPLRRHRTRRSHPAGQLQARR